MILFSAEAIFASSSSKFGIWVPLTEHEDFRSSTESANSTSVIHSIASEWNCEQVHTSVLNLIFQEANVADVQNLSKWGSEIFAFYQRSSWSRFWVARRENCFGTEKNHPEYPLQKKNQSRGNESSKRRPLPSRKTYRLPDLRVLPGHWSQAFCRELCRPIHYWSSKLRYSGIRFKVGRNFIINDKNSTWWHLGRIVQIKNTRVWETQDRIGIVWPGDSSEENRTWL